MAEAARRTTRTDTTLWRSEALDAELLRGRFADFSYDQHSHETACLALIDEGAIRIRMRGGSFVARKGDLYAIDADEPHAGEPVDAGGWRQRTIYVDAGTLRARLDGGGGEALSLCGPIIRDASLNQLFHTVHRLSEHETAALRRDETYLDFATTLLGRHARRRLAGPAAGHAPQAIIRAKEFLDAELSSRVALAEIAAAAGLSPFRLYRCFERATGLTPHAYQRQARLRLARRLIRTGRPLAEIAAETGFADQAHLTRCFHRSFGLTPGRYRAAYRGRPA